MRFKIHGADRETGEESIFELDCPTVQEARANANAAGFLVNKIEPLMVSASPSQNEQVKRKSPSLALSCPKCGSENTQRLCVIHQAGTSKTNSTGQLKAVQNPYLWPVPDSTIRGTINTAGVHQSDLARLAAPPSPPEAPDKLNSLLAVTVFGVLGVLVVFIWRFKVADGFFDGISSGLVGVLVVIVLTIIALCVVMMMPSPPLNPEAIASYEKRKQAWERKFLCLRCGHIYIPSGDANVKRR